MNAARAKRSGGWRLVARDAFEDVAGLIDGSALQPDRLGAMSQKELAALPLRVGRRTRKLGDLFELERVKTPGRLELPGSDRWEYLGAGMEGGEIVVDGHVGYAAGQRMRGGRIEIRGRAEERLGASMTGGLILAAQCWGRAGGPAADDDVGMRGGEIIIAGNAGDEIGLRMRRGLIAVRGEVGSFPGYAMLAGTIVVGQGRPCFPGLRMRRGSILLAGRSSETAGWAHALPAGRFELRYLRLLERRLRELGETGLADSLRAPFWLHSADHFPASPREPVGRGEILVRDS